MSATRQEHEDVRAARWFGVFAKDSETLGIDKRLVLLVAGKSLSDGEYLDASNLVRDGLTLDVDTLRPQKDMEVFVAELDHKHGYPRLASEIAKVLKALKEEA